MGSVVTMLPMFTRKAIPTRIATSRSGSRLRCGLVAALLVSLAATSCGDDDDRAEGGGTLTVYSGRSEELIAPIFDAFSAETGIDVDVKYGDSAELALLIETEGDASTADMFISQSPGAVSYLDGLGRLSELPADVIGQVDEAYRATDGTWTGVTGRVRTLVYNTDLVDPASLPDSVLDLADPAYAGQVGVAPTNGSFQDFVTAMRLALGDDETASWLDGMAANESPAYDRNSAIVEAVSRGEIPMGLVNHYYVLEFKAEDPNAPLANHFFPATDLGSLLITTGVSIVDTADDVPAAEQLLAFFLTPEAQTMFSAGEGEYPLIAGVPVPESLPELSGLGYVIDLDELGGGLARTTELIAESGLS